MTPDRYVLLGLAGVRAGWFGDVAHWATSATLPVRELTVGDHAEADASSHEHDKGLACAAG